MVTAMLTKLEKDKIKKICHLSDITHADIAECVENYRYMIDNKDYHKARIIKYALYTILTQEASIKIIEAVKNAIYEMNSYEKLFSYERWK